MSNNYEQAPATKMLAKHCIVCGRALVDAVSVTMGIGPECRQGDDGGYADEIRTRANKLVFAASIAAQAGRVEQVLEVAECIRVLGMVELADKVARRFRAAVSKAERDSDIVITEFEGGYRVVTPFRRGAKAEFIEAWRSIPGRKWSDGANWVPKESKAALIALLKQFFAGKYARGPKGVFRIEQPQFVAKQDELALKVA